MSMFRRMLMMAQAMRSVLPVPIAAWSAAGKTNEDEDRAVLKDLTGNGHDITLKGFAFSGMSGYGGYKVDFIKTFSTLKSRVEGTATGTKINITKVIETNAFIENGVAKVIPSFKIKVSGNTSNGIYVRYRFYVDIEGSVQAKFIDLKTDGVYTLPQTYESSYNGFVSSKIGECDITIELLPEYPDALVFDGVDDYGICRNMPVQEDFTLITKLYCIDNNSSWLISKSYTAGQGAFRLGSDVYSFGGTASLLDNNDLNGIKYLTKSSFNGESLIIGSGTDGNNLWLGKLRESAKITWKGAFYSAYLFDRSLTEEEIKAFIRKNIDPSYLLPSEIPTPDCYYDFNLGSNDDENREVVKDQSSNGNDAKIYNCAFAGMSGYGGYAIDFNSFTKHIGSRIEGSYTSNTFLITSILPSSSSDIVFAEKIDTILNFDSYYIKIDGIEESDVSKFAVNVKGTDGIYYDLISIEKDGTYKVNSVNNSYETNAGYRFKFGFNEPPSDKISNLNINIEILPEYEGALVLDGVDDYVALEAFDSGFKTVFMLCNPFVLGDMLYDQRFDDGVGSDFAIYNSRNSIAYCYRNINPTYINNILNTSLLTDSLINKKQLISVRTEVIKSDTNLFIGCGRDKHNNSNMAIYKFLGFKEALNEDQIKAVIQKYNLLDGVDEIEVS